MRVLIIDDEEDTRSIFSMSLGLLGGVDVIEARNGTEGIVKAAEEKPDVIILDLLMPEMDGTQTFLLLKSEPKTERIPVIFMTVKGMFSEFEALKRLGALAVIAKPFDPTTLTQLIKSILETNGYSHVTGNGQGGQSTDHRQKAEEVCALEVVSEQSSQAPDSACEKVHSSDTVISPLSPAKKAVKVGLRRPVPAAQKIFAGKKKKIEKPKRGAGRFER